MTELCELFKKYGSDKCEFYSHTYSPEYFNILKDKQSTCRQLVEIGVGSIALMSQIVPPDKYLPGASLRAWNDFFPNAGIFGLDINETDFFEHDRIKCLFTDQSKESELLKTFDIISGLSGERYCDIIIDDGSHVVHDMLLSYQTLKNFLKPGGIYIIEDIRDYEMHHFNNLGCNNFKLIQEYKAHWDKITQQNAFVAYQRSL